jgi:8-oxo-dGTP pyrophosphatase MutT (NUDIX family)
MELPRLIDNIADAIGVLNTTSTPTQRLVGGGVVVNKLGQLLVLYADFAYQGWHFPKGGLDEGETSLEGAIREVFEESGGAIATLFSGNIKFELNPGKVYREPIGFGSARGEPDDHRTSEKISLGADHLLTEAAKESGVDLELLAKHKYEIFDALVDRNIRVAWVTVPTYHLLVHTGGTYGPTWESQAVEWHTPEEIRNLRPPGKKHGGARVGGAAKTILDWPGFAEMIEQAKREATL